MGWRVVQGRENELWDADLELQCLRVPEVLLCSHPWCGPTGWVITQVPSLLSFRVVSADDTSVRKLSLLLVTEIAAHRDSTTLEYFGMHRARSPETQCFQQLHHITKDMSPFPVSVLVTTMYELSSGQLSSVSTRCLSVLTSLQWNMNYCSEIREATPSFIDKENFF